MDFELKEHIELSAYRCELTANESLTSKLNEHFEMNLRDLFSNNVYSINYSDLFDKYGLTDQTTHPDTPDLWMEDSMIKNGGLCVYFNNNKMYMKMLNKCVDSDGNHLGFNSSKVEIFFTESGPKDIAFHARILPFLLRDKLKKYEQKNDPVIPNDTEEGIRPDYDFGNNNDFPEIENQIPKTNTIYPEVDYLYVNNINPDNIIENTPLYISEVSAIFANTDTYAGIDLDSLDCKSYLLDTENNTEINIPYLPETDQQINIPINDDLTMELYYKKYTQYIQFENNIKDHRKNRLILDLALDNHGVEKVTLKSCIVVIDGNNHVTITNPNEIGTEIFTQVTINNVDVTDQILNKVQNENVLEFDIGSFEINDGATILIKGWIEDYVIGYNKEEVISATTGVAYKLIAGKEKISIKYSPNDPDSCRKYTNSFISFDKNTEPAPYHLLTDEEKGVSKLELKNPNNDRTNTDIITINIQGDSNIKIQYEISDETERMNNYVETGIIVFYIYDIPVGEVDISAKIGTGDYYWNTLTYDDLPEVHIWNNGQNVESIFIKTCIDKNYNIQKCKKYTGLDKENTGVETDEHILMTYEDENKNEYGISWFRIFNPNKNSRVMRSFSDQIKIDIFRNGELVNTVINGENSTTEKTYILGGWDTHAYEDDGYIDFYVKNIDPSIIYVEVTITPEQDAKDWNFAKSTSIEWKNNPFIPEKYEQLEDYVLFSHSYLYLNGAYVGVKAVYAPGIYADNGAIIDCILIISCTNNDGKPSYIYTNNININHHYDAINKTFNYWKPEDDPNSSTTRDYGGEILFNNKCPTQFIVPQDKVDTYTTNQIFQNQNNAVLGYDKVKVAYSTIDKFPDLEILKFDYDYTNPNPAIVVNDRTEYELDAQGKIVSYESINLGNNCTLHFKSGGEYLFDTFFADTNLNIIIDDIHDQTVPFVRIACKTSFKVSTGLNITNDLNNSDLKSFMVYCDGTGDSIQFGATTSTSRNFGVLVAPNGGIDFQNTVVWTGAVWAKKLAMANGCIFLSDSSENIWSN